MVMRWHALWCVWFIDCYCFPVFLCEAEMYVYEILDLTIFELSISYIWITFQSPWWDWCLFWSWWCHVVICLTWPFWESSINIVLRYFLVAHWELMDILIYHLMLFSCSWRTDVNIVNYILIFLSRLYRAEVILLWFFDLWFHEPRVGYLYVVSGSGLQWGPRP